MDRRVAWLVMLMGTFMAGTAWWCVASQSTPLFPVSLVSQDADEPRIQASDDRNQASYAEVPSRSVVPAGPRLPVVRVLVRDDRQRMLGGIDVLLLNARDRSVIVAEGTTGIETGAVSLALEVGRYDLCINTQGAGAREYSSSVEVISMGRSPTLSIERTLQRRDASLEVVVQDDLGALVPGIEVSTDSFRSIARTGLRGEVRIDRLLPGMTSVVARRSTATPIGVAVPESLTKVVVLEHGQTTLCFFDVERTGSLDTRLECANARGVQPEQVAVELIYVAGAYSHPIKGRSVTLGETVRFQHVPPGSYEVRYSLPAESALGISEDRSTVVVESGGVAKFVGRAVAGGGVVAGRITCEGVPVVGVPMSVAARSADGSWGHWQWKTGQTKNGGRFEFRGLPETSYRLFIQSHLAPGTQEFAYFGSFEKPYLELHGSTSGLEIQLQPGVLLKGHVVEGDTPVAQGKVSLNRARFNAEIAVDLRHDRPGLFEFHHLRAGSYVLRFHRGREVVASRKISIGGAAKPPIEIKWDVKKMD